MTICTFATRAGRPAATGLGAGDWLGLAATPTFAVMALISGLSDGGAHDALCVATQHAGPFGAMTFMYALMSVFHTAPWLRRIGRWRSGS